MKIRRILLFVIFLASLTPISGQSISKEIQSLWNQQQDTSHLSVRDQVYLSITDKEFRKLFDDQPSFGMFHDNYFITGVPTNKPINNETANAKFQISISQRLTKSILPFNSTLLLTFTQKSFWDIYEDSAPFADNNYNPGLTLVRPILRNNKLKGVATLSAEHESNGLDSIYSRRWNFITVSGTYFYNANISVQANFWAGKLGDDNKDLFRYRGHGLLAMNYRNNKDNLWCSLILNPTEKFRSVNTTCELNYKPGKKANQYLFIQWYNGYGESLLDYNQYSSMVRFGICIKPMMRNFY